MKLQIDVYEVYFSASEKNGEPDCGYPTRYFCSLDNATDYAKRQLLSDNYFIAHFVWSGSLLDALNGDGVQSHRKVVSTS